MLKLIRRIWELRGEGGRIFLLQSHASPELPNAGLMVVAGINYFFKFADGTTVKIFEQSWTNTFRVEEPCRPAGSVALPAAASTAVESAAVAGTAAAEGATSSHKGTGH